MHELNGGWTPMRTAVTRVRSAGWARLPLAFASAAGLLIICLLPVNAAGHYVRVNWSYKGSESCAPGKATDPVTVVFQGSGARTDRVHPAVPSYSGRSRLMATSDT